MNNEICLNEAFAEDDDSIEDVLNKEYDRGYEQGKIDGAREFAEWLLVNHTLDCIECNSGDKSIGCKECANEYLAEWQKGEENEQDKRI